jgi:hypothetical protein
MWREADAGAIEQRDNDGVPEEDRCNQQVSKEESEL